MSGAPLLADGQVADGDAPHAEEFFSEADTDYYVIADDSIFRQLAPGNYSIFISAFSLEDDQYCPEGTHTQHRRTRTCIRHNPGNYTRATHGLTFHVFAPVPQCDWSWSSFRS
jgi:hypothetical protein